MEFITISRRHLLTGVIESYSSQDTELKGIQNLLRTEGYWSSARRSSPATGSWQRPTLIAWSAGS